MKQSDLTTAVMLPGGGARGAYQVGVLKGIMSLMPDGFHFPIINGTSAGAINAVVLASHAKNQVHGVKRLEHFWSTIHCADVYRTDSWTITRTLARVFGSLLFGRFGVSGLFRLLGSADLFAYAVYRAIEFI